MTFLQTLESVLDSLGEALKPASSHSAAVIADLKQTLSDAFVCINAEIAYLHSRIDQSDPAPHPPLIDASHAEAVIAEHPE
jgi:hypothetical protein